MRPIYVITNGKVDVHVGVKATLLMAEKFKQEAKCLCVEDATVECELATEQLGDDAIENFTEQADASMLVFTLSENAGKREIQKWLNFSRQLRIPYLFVKEGMEISFKQVDVPITFLEEEKEKAPFAGAFGRQFGATINLITATDYGHKAKANTNAITAVLDSFPTPYNQEMGKGDSFKVENEVVTNVKKRGTDLVILSASREYGLDDILFHPKECKLIQKSEVPLLLINPRGDLYALCE